jgi:outer membrane protein assembly factor BamB
MRAYLYQKKYFFNLMILGFLLITTNSGYGQSVEQDAKALLEKIGFKTGLCLVVGAKDVNTSDFLASQSSLYIQILQPEPKLAMQWGMVIANSVNREKLGIRNSTFDTNTYGSDLFNLILVEDVAGFEKIKLSELMRLLVPKGFIAFKNLPAGYSDEIKKLKLETLAVNSFTTVIQKPKLPFEWKICDSFKWRAGPRAQHSTGWSSLLVADGKFFYREEMEVPFTLETASSQFFARDAYNGRVLWSIEESKWHGGPRPIAFAKGKLFMPFNEKLVCMDANTGVLLFELIGSGLEKKWALNRLEIVDELVIAQGEVGFRAFSINDGKEQWKINAVSNWLRHQDKLITSNRGVIEARSVKDPTKSIWKVNQIGFKMIGSDKYLHVNTKERDLPEIVTLDLNTGEIVWKYNVPDPGKKRGYKFDFFENKFYIYAYSAYENKDQDLWITKLDLNTGKLESEDCGPKGANPFNMCAPLIHKVGKFVVYFFSVWVDLKDNSRVFPYLAHPSCHFGTIFEEGMMFNTPSRKVGPLQGLTAMAPADLKFDHETGGKVLKKYSDVVLGPEAKEDEWPMFRGNMERGNAVNANPSEKPAKLWEASFGIGGKSFGVLSSQRTGLTQPIVVNGMVIVADIDSQRIIALDAITGKQKWMFPVGSRVDFSPAYYKGLCLLVGKDGWVYCLNASTGMLAWKLLIAPYERLIGGQEKLESQWPMASDVLIIDGIGYVNSGIGFDHFGGVRAVAFKADSGEIVWSQTYFDEKHFHYGAGYCANMFTAQKTAKGLILSMDGILIDPTNGKITNRNGNIAGVLRGDMDNYLAGGNSIPRNGEDRGAVGLSDGRIWGKMIAFDKDLSVASSSSYGAETWVNKLKINFNAKKVPGKVNFWEKADWEMTVDDLVLTPKYIYCVGHYQRIKKEPELLVLAREDGVLLHSTPIEGFPSQNGMSIAGSKIFVTTREGKIICFEGK